MPSFADTGRSDAPALAEALGRISVWGVPLLVTGAGMPTDDDAERCSYLLDQVQAIEAGRLRGVAILGFCYRSLLDGFEWRHGLTRRYGLIHVDRETLARTPNPSAFLYQDIARNGGIRPGAVARYCPAWRTPAKEAS